MGLPDFRSDEPPEPALMRQAGHVAARAHEALEEMVEPGGDGEQLNQRAETVIRDHGARPAFEEFGGNSFAITVSVNDTLIHGPPDHAGPFQPGDVVSVDLGALVEGHYSDTAVTHMVGEPRKPRQRDLVERTKTGLYAGIQAATAGRTLRDIGRAIESASGPFGNVTDWAGHFIGRRLHYGPQVHNTADQNENFTLETGMFLAIEPVYTTGSNPNTLEESSGGVRTASGSIGAHFEHTVYVGTDRVELVTGREREPDFL